MQTGVVSSENLSQVLRSISQRRQQGVLEINFANRKVEIFFILGKVVDVHYGDSHPSIDFCNKLKVAGLVDRDFEPEEGTYPELFEKLSASGQTDGALDLEKFKWALRQQVLERVYQLDFSSGSYFQFNVRMVEIDREIVPSVSVGQLLLDLVALETESERFDEIFKPGLIVIASDATGAGLSEEEQSAFDLVRGDGVPVEDLSERSLLSKYNLQEALIALYDTDLLIVTEPVAAAPEPIEGEATAFSGQIADITEALDDILDSDFDGELCEDEPLVEDGEERMEVASTAEESQHEETDDDDYDEEEDDEDESYGGVSLGFKVRVGLHSAKLLQVSWIPHLLVIVFLVVAFISPWLWWGIYLGALQTCRLQRLKVAGTACSN